MVTGRRCRSGRAHAASIAWVDVRQRRDVAADVSLRVARTLRVTQASHYEQLATEMDVPFSLTLLSPSAKLLTLVPVAAATGRALLRLHASGFALSLRTAQAAVLAPAKASPVLSARAEAFPSPALLSASGLASTLGPAKVAPETGANGGGVVESKVLPEWGMPSGAPLPPTATTSDAAVATPAPQGAGIPPASAEQGQPVVDVPRGPAVVAEAPAFGLPGPTPISAQPPGATTPGVLAQTAEPLLPGRSDKADGVAGRPATVRNRRSASLTSVPQQRSLAPDIGRPLAHLSKPSVAEAPGSVPAVQLPAVVPEESPDQPIAPSAQLAVAHPEPSASALAPVLMAGLRLDTGATQRSPPLERPRVSPPQTDGAGAAKLLSVAAATGPNTYFGSLGSGQTRVAVAADSVAPASQSVHSDGGRRAPGAGPPLTAAGSSLRSEETSNFGVESGPHFAVKANIGRIPELAVPPQKAGTSLPVALGELPSTTLVTRGQRQSQADAPSPTATLSAEPTAHARPLPPADMQPGISAEMIRRPTADHKQIVQQRYSYPTLPGPSGLTPAAGHAPRAALATAVVLAPPAATDAKLQPGGKAARPSGAPMPERTVVGDRLRQRARRLILAPLLRA